MNDSILAVSVPVSYTDPGELDGPARSARMDLSWASMDPTAIMMRFDNGPLIQNELGETEHDYVTWVVSRDMFADCLLNEPGGVYGQGDASLERGEVSFHLHLLGDGNRTVDVSFFTARVAKLIHDSLMIVPRGEAEADVFEAGVDDFIAQVLGQ